MSIEEQYKQYGVVHGPECEVCAELGITKPRVAHIRPPTADFWVKVVFFMVGAAIGVFAALYVAYNLIPSNHTNISNSP